MTSGAGPHARRGAHRASAASIVGVGCALSLALLGTAFALGRARALRDRWPAEMDALYLPSARVLEIMSLGHRELAAGLVAARANVYFGAQIAAKAPQRHLERYLHTAVDLDPRFHRIYLGGAAMLVYNGRQITPESVLAAVRLLERGRAHFPADWELAFQIGFNKLFELPKLVGEGDPRVAGWRQEGVEALRAAALLDGVPNWLPNLVARLLTKQGSEALSIKHLEQAYAVTSSAETREEIRRKLLYLQREQGLSRMEEQRRQLEERLEAGYPYAPEAFSIIAGPRRTRALGVQVRTQEADGPPGVSSGP